MKKVSYLFIFLYLFAFTSEAQFSGSYAAFNWTTTLSVNSDGIVNTADAPNSITITGSDGISAPNVDTDYTVTAVSSGTWSFDWSYHTNDGDEIPAFDIAGILINGTFTQLTNNAGGIDQSGSYTAPYVTAGSTIGFRIRATDNFYGDATFTISNFSPPVGVLPVKLNSFNAKQEGSHVVLRWITESEVNTSHYEVERSANGSNFNSIALLAAQNTSTLQSYSSIDGMPLSGMNYYRLRMVDKDGKLSLSHIVSVKLNATTPKIALYPNPAKDNLTITIVTEKPTEENLLVYDASGRLLKNQTLNLVTGLNKTNLNISSLTKGIYFIKAERRNIVQAFAKE